MWLLFFTGASNSKYDGLKYYPLAVSQSSAIEKRGGCLQNDATNGCAFLCTLIGQYILQHREPSSTVDNDWEQLATASEDIIRKTPIKFNNLRDKAKHYDPLEAYNILSKGGIIQSKYEFGEILLGADPALSQNGKQKLEKSLAEMIVEKSEPGKVKVAMYTCGGYIFLIGCTASKQLFMLDTHRISQELGGKGGGMLVVTASAAVQLQVDSLCSWIAKRLEHSGIRSNQGHTLSVM